MSHLAPLVLALIAMTDPPTPPTPIDIVTALETALTDAIAKAEPSVVAIARLKEGKGEETLAIPGRVPPYLIVRDQQLNGFGGFRGNGFDDPDEELMASDYGSGIVIGDRGEMLTTFHVVKGAKHLLVRAPGTKEFEAVIIAADPRSDLAVIVPREDTGRPRPKLKPIPLGDAGRLRKGNFLLALGNPFNAGRDGKASASWGILANVSRRLELPSSGAEQPFTRQLRNYPTLLQLDAKLNLGMSGGAVVNLKGELVGLTTNAANTGGFDSQAGYALPIDVLSRRAIEALKQGKEVEYGFLGIGLSTNGPDSGSNRILNVKPGTPAGEGGLLEGDAVISVGGIPIVDADTLVLAVNSFTPGLPIKVRIRRDEVEFDKVVVLSKLPVQGEMIATNRQAPWRGVRVDFVSTDPKSVKGDLVLEAMARGGVLVTEVEGGSNAETAGLKVGQIVIAVDGQPVKNPAEFAKAVDGRKGPIVLMTEGNQPVTIK